MKSQQTNIVLINFRIYLIENMLICLWIWYWWEILGINAFFLLLTFKNNSIIDAFLLALSFATTHNYVRCVKKMCSKKMSFWPFNGICWLTQPFVDNSAIGQLMTDENKSSLFKVWFLDFFLTVKLELKLDNYVSGSILNMSKMLFNIGH